MTKPSKRDQLVAIFKRERAAFGLPQARLGLSTRKVVRKEDRNCAVAEPAAMTIWFHPEALETLTRGNMEGLVRHELAHLLDPALSESDTDCLAEEVSGKRLYYDHRLIQTTAKGTRPRPSRLPEW